jgi:uncharacterized protein
MPILREGGLSPPLIFMDFSPYLKKFPHPQKPGWSVLFSGRKGSLATLPDSAVELLAAGKPLADNEMAALARMGLVVNDPAAERAKTLGLMDEVNRLSPGLSVAVILTLDCNFNCRYCYEGTLKAKQAMSETTAEQAIAFIKARFRPEHKKLVLDFYGGEPLLARDRIKQLSGPLKEFTEGQGAEFYFTLVTNGSLLTPRAAEELKPFGLRVAKVTLDGPADLHDRSRPFKNGKGSFEAILRNVRECCHLLKIGIQGNYAQENFRRFPELFDRLAEKGLGPEHFLQATFAPVMQTKDEFALADFNDGCCTMSEPWLADAAVWLREETLKRGYQVPKITPSTCMVDLDDAFTVHVDGSLYKCMGFIGHTDYAVGDVWQGMKECGEIYNLEHWRQNEKCRECSYLPLCFGGCRYMEFQRHGVIKGVDCQEAFWDSALERLIQQSVLYPRG